MNENMKILIVIASILLVGIIFYEFKERKVQAQDVLGTDVRIQDNTPADKLVPKDGLLGVEEEKIEVSPDQSPPIERQRRSLKQPLRRPQPLPRYQSQPQPQTQPQSGGCLPGSGCK